MSFDKRVVVTGLGIVSPLGLNVRDTWNAVLESKSGVSKLNQTHVTDEELSSFPVKIAAQVKNFDPTLYFQSKDIKKVDYFIQYGMAATVEAINDSGIDLSNVNLDRVGVSVGSGIGGLPAIEKAYSSYLKGGVRKISPFFIPSSITNMLSGYISIRYGFRGPCISLVTACATGSHNIGNAMRLIQCGDADVFVAGGSEMSIGPLGIGGFVACRALSMRNDSPEQASRPWDKDRDGFVLGEGAGILVLEEYEHAKNRGARIYAELIGYGASCDAYHITSPDTSGSGASLSMLNAIKDADISPHDVNYINAHATSTKLGDEVENSAVKQVFGKHAYKVPMSSTKSMTGHMLGAAGSVEAIFCILSIRDNFIPPTINLDNPDCDCDLDYVPYKARRASVNVAISNSFGFSGTNSTLIFARMD